MIGKETVEQLAEECISERNEQLYLVAVSIGKYNAISVAIDHETSFVKIEDCIAISRNIEHQLDREREDFSLEVSSAGMDKPFRSVKQYIKHVGKTVRVHLQEDGKVVEGILKSADESGCVVEARHRERVEGKKKKEWVTVTHPLQYHQIKATKLIISF